MKNETIKNGIAGAVIGATMIAGVGYNPADIDPLTDISYSEIVEKPDIDVYYIVNVADIVGDMENKSMSKLNTARYSLDGKRVILKYNVGDMDRNVAPEKYGEPFTNAEILKYLQNPENGFYDPNEII